MRAFGAEDEPEDPRGCTSPTEPLDPTAGAEHEDAQPADAAGFPPAEAAPEDADPAAGAEREPEDVAGATPDAAAGKHAWATEELSIFHATIAAFSVFEYLVSPREMTGQSLSQVLVSALHDP